MRLSVIGSFLALLGLVAAPASAALWTTTDVSPSSLTIGVVLYGNDEEGNPIVIDGGTLGPQSVTGTADADVALTAGDGTLTFNSAALAIQNGSFTIDLATGLPDGGLGTVDATFTDVAFTLVSDGIPVTGNLWNLDVNPPGAFALILNQGSLLLNNATGVLGALIPPEGENVDLSTDPVSVALADLIGYGINGTASDDLVTMNIPTTQIDIGASLGLGAGFLFLTITGQVNLAPVPEPSSIALMGMGLVGLAGYGFRRRLARK